MCVFGGFLRLFAGKMMVLRGWAKNAQYITKQRQNVSKQVLTTNPAAGQLKKGNNQFYAIRCQNL
jgi:hypothetical protein